MAVLTLLLLAGCASHRSQVTVPEAGLVSRGQVVRVEFGAIPLVDPVCGTDVSPSPLRWESVLEWSSLLPADHGREALQRDLEELVGGEMPMTDLGLCQVHECESAADATRRLLHSVLRGELHTTSLDAYLARWPDSHVSPWVWGLRFRLLDTPEERVRWYREVRQAGTAADTTALLSWLMTCDPVALSLLTNMELAKVERSVRDAPGPLLSVAGAWAAKRRRRRATNVAEDGLWYLARSGVCASESAGISTDGSWGPLLCQGLLADVSAVANLHGIQGLSGVYLESDRHIRGALAECANLSCGQVIWTRALNGVWHRTRPSRSSKFDDCVGEVLIDLVGADDIGRQLTVSATGIAACEPTSGAR
jgi:hypothetical protein